MKLGKLLEDTRYTIFCDMDGVLTDFSGDFIKLAKSIPDNDLEEVRTDVPNNEPHDTKKLLDQKHFGMLLNTLAGVKFWSDMSWNKGGQKLWKYISQYNVEILTAPSKRVYDDCVKGKKMWIKRLGNPPIHIRSKEKKKEFAEKTQS